MNRSLFRIRIHGSEENNISANLHESEQASKEILSYLAKFFQIVEGNLSPFLDLNYFLLFLLIGWYFSASFFSEEEGQMAAW